MRFLKNLLCKVSYPDLPVYDSYKDAPKKSVFRLPRDNKNVLRFNYVFKNGKSIWAAIEAWKVHVAGVSYRPKVVTSFIYGEQRSVEVEKRPTKKYPHALAVIGKWKDTRRYHQKSQLGYVPDDEAKEITDIIKKHPGSKILSELGMIYLPTKDKNPGIRIDVAVF